MIAIILAGGNGTRLWPYSRNCAPKQFLNLGSNEKSLFQETIVRLKGIVSSDNIYVVGSVEHELEIKQQMEGIHPKYNPEQLLFEPLSRNTAPAILLAILKIPDHKQEESVLVLASDHLINSNSNFFNSIKNAEKLSSSGFIVTFGIQPDRPETGYGYIKAGEALEIGFKVDHFVEKPDQETAESYLESSNYTWNASIFMATKKTWLAEFRKHVPELLSSFEKKINYKNNLDDPSDILAIYESLSAESLDYALLEKSKNIAVLPVEMEWNDLGSWESIYRVSKKDSEGNVLRGDVITHNTHNSLIFSSKKLVTSIGIDNLIIVETDDAFLVCDMSCTQDVKKLVEILKREDRQEYKFHPKIIRSWGSGTTILENRYCRIRMLEILPGKTTNMKSNKYWSEQWIVIKGSAELQKGEEKILIKENESIFIPLGVPYCVTNFKTNPIHIIEIQQGNYPILED